MGTLRVWRQAGSTTKYLGDDDRPYDPVPTRKDRRLVFVEHIEIRP